MSRSRQPAHAKPQPGLEDGRKDQQAATRVISQERQRQFNETRKVLDVLRKTRSQRDVGELEIPRHLQGPLVVTDRELRAGAKINGRELDPRPPRAAGHVILDPATGRPFDE